MISESSIIEGCLNENKTYQNELYKRYSSKMMVVCLRYAKDKMEAEDILQEGFIKIYDNISKFRMQGSFEGWIRRIMVNTALNKIKTTKMVFENIDDIGDEFIEPIIEDTTLNEKVLLDIISKLPKGYKYVFNMYAIEGFNHKEIANSLGIEEASSRSQYAKAKKYLQQKLIELQNGEINK
jgi:RNA polymerase sigma-70 factor (ECF subfamily)